MASRGIEIPLTLNPAQLIRGLRVTETGFDDLADKVDELGRAGDQAADKLEDLADDGRRDMDRLADEVDDTEQAFRDFARGADASMDKVRRSADSAERGVDDLTDEVGDSAREFGSAFRGDPVEALEEVQSLASELATRFIPGIGGAVLSVAGGVAFSALIGFYERWKEEQEAINERVRGFRDEVLDAFGVLEKGVIDQALIARLDEAGVSAQELEGYLEAAPEALRVGFRQALQSGDLNALHDLTVDIEEQARHINSTFVAVGSALTPGQQAVLDLNKALGGTTGELQQGVQDAQSLARMLGNDTTDAADDVGDAVSDWQDPLGATVDAIKNIDGKIGDVDAAALGLSRGALRDFRDRLREAESAAAGMKANINGIPGSINTTLSVNVQGANAKANRILAQIDSAAFG